MILNSNLPAVTNVWHDRGLCFSLVGSESDYSYKSYVSAGGTRHVTRRRKRADGTYSAAHSYHSSQDPEGRARRQKRRAVRKAVAVKAEKARMAKVC